MAIQRQAVVDGSNIVINIVSVDTTKGWTPSAGTTAVVSSGANIGDTYDSGGGTFTPPSPGPSPAPYEAPTPIQLLFVKRAADMHVTTDQIFTKVFGGTLYKPTMIVGKRVSGGASVACLGGVYTAASKGGDALVASTQSWINLTADKKIVNASLAALVDTDIHSETPYLSLSTGSTAACGADIFIYGVILD